MCKCERENLALFYYTQKSYVEFQKREHCGYVTEEQALSLAIKALENVRSLRAELNVKQSLIRKN